MTNEPAKLDLVGNAVWVLVGLCGILFGGPVYGTILGVIWSVAFTFRRHPLT